MPAAGPTTAAAAPFLWLAALAAAACTAAPAKDLEVHVLRLLPGQDLRGAIEDYAARHTIEAGWIASCAGSLTDWTLRFADRPDGASGRGRFEIVALSGTVSVHGSHLHLAIADADGRTLGGHLLAGCRVYTTAEIVLQASRRHVFTRKVDGSTPWPELQVERR